MIRTIRFTLNEKPVSIEVDDERTLLWVLRTDLGLTGAKFGCGEGLCGACTVLVDEEAVPSCQMTVGAVAEKRVKTIEGLPRNGQLHPIQKAFVEHDALQCGFCTPRHDSQGSQPPGIEFNADPRPDHFGVGRQPLPLRRPCSHCRSRPGRVRSDERRKIMMKKPNSTEEESILTAPFVPIGRRAFLKRMGLLSGGLIVYCTIGDIPAQARAPREGFIGGNVPTDFNAFLRIGADSRVTCFVGKIEMGQGPITSFAQMMAEELDVSYEVVDMVMGDTDRCPWDAGTWGSLSTRYYGVFVKEAAAEAKGVLKELAAERLACPAARLVTEKGLIFDREHPASRVSYGELTAGKIIERHLKDLPPLKPASEYTISGKPYLRRDAHDKVTGRALYTADVRLPGMVYARILRPPAHGAKRLSLDTTAAEKMTDVQVVRDGDLIAVLHPHPDGAADALAAIRADFDVPETGITDKTIFDHLLKNAPTPVVASEAGHLQEGEKQAASVVDETYLNSYVAHAPLEPHAALAAVDGNRITVWASTQAPFSVQGLVAQALGEPAKNVRVITPFVGGGIRRKVGIGPGRRSGAACKTFRQTCNGDLDPGGGILFRYLPAGCRGQNSIGDQQRGTHLLLGLPGLFRR